MLEKNGAKPMKQDTKTYTMLVKTQHLILLYLFYDFVCCDLFFFCCWSLVCHHLFLFFFSFLNEIRNEGGGISDKNLKPENM